VLGGRLSMTGTCNYSLIWVMIRIVCPQPASVAYHLSEMTNVPPL
jgi:hypothetical protein